MFCILSEGGYNSGYEEGSGWSNPWESNNPQGNWDSQDYGDQGWSQEDSFEESYRQNYGGGPLRSNHSTQRSQPYNTGKLQKFHIMMFFYCKQSHISCLIHISL